MITVKDHLYTYFRTNEKQFLFTRKVPCTRRCSQLQYDPKLELIVKDEASQEEWVDTHFYSNESTGEVKDLSMEETKPKPAPADNDDEDETPVDLDEFMASDEVEDPNCFKPPVPTETTETEDNVLKTRTYNLHITYDKYYQVNLA